MATEVYLIRHGESFANVDPIIGGMRGDAGLTARGHEQARLLEARLAAVGPRVDALYSSTLPRAVQTTEYVARAFGLSATFDDVWQELRPGEADGLSLEEFERRYGQVLSFFTDPYRLFAPGGESWADMQLRIGRALHRLVEVHPDQAVAVVCHGGVLEASFQYAFGMGPTGAYVRFLPLNTSITHWRHHPTGDRPYAYWTLITFNDAAHLQGRIEAASPRPAVPTPADEPA